MKNITIIGYGAIAKHHIQVFEALNCKIVATCVRSKEKQEKALQSGIPNVYTNYHEMIKETQPDAIIVCVSFWNMYTVLKEVIPYGLPILSEKPSATSLTEHKELVQLAEQYNTPVMIGLNRRQYSVLEQAIEAAGGKEAITNVLVEWSEDPNHLVHNRNLTDVQLRTYNFGNTIHGLDFVCDLCGPLTDYHLNVRDQGHAYSWIINVSGVSCSGSIFNFNCSWANHVPWRVVFYAENKRFVMAPLETVQFFEGKAVTNIEPSIEDKRFKAGFYRQAKHFIANDFKGQYDLASATPAMILAQAITDRF